MVFITPIAFARRARRVGFNMLTTKIAKKGFYKGKGAINVGTRTKHGAFKTLKWKLPQYAVPEGFAASALKPYAEVGPK
jgi:large subunit ribosomal protein L41